MVSTERGRFRSAFWRSIGVFLLSVPPGTNAVEISNGIPAGTVGHFRVVVEDGGATRNVTITAARFASDDTVTRNVVGNYYIFFDRGDSGRGERLRAPLPVPNPLNPNGATSNGFLFGVNGPISWTAVSSIAPGAQVMTTTYTFVAEPGKALGPLRLLQHLDAGVPFPEGASDDVFFRTGSAVGGDLKLFTFDNTDIYGISHSGALLPGNDLQNASFAGWAADHFDNITASILTTGQPVSPNAIPANLSSFPHPQLGPVFGPADIVSVLAWDVAPTATSAVITTSLGAVPISALTGPTSSPVELQPVGNLLAGNQIRCRRKTKKCTFQATCIVSPSPGARCTNQVNVTVTKKALGSSGGAPRVNFASGAPDIAPGESATVQLRPTKRARSFLRSTAKGKINATLEITSINGVVSNAFRARIRIRN